MTAVIPLLVAALGGFVSALAFPRFGPGILIVPGIAAFLASLRLVESRGRGFVVGWLYGITFFTVLMWWSTELGLIALIPLVIVEGLFFGGFGWWLASYRETGLVGWALLATGGWAVAEWFRYHIPFSGLEWGAAGYSLSDYGFVRAGAGSIGVSGWTVAVVFLAALAVASMVRQTRWWVLPAGVGVVILLVAPGLIPSDYGGQDLNVAIVQGSTPCPYERCGTDERLRTYEQHLELTRRIPSGGAGLVVWAEGSTGSSNADPVQNPEIGASIAAEAKRIGAWFLVGSDRPISPEEWINANVVFDHRGVIVGEYRKQQGVPFGEYIPFRPLFDWIPELSQVPRDMVPGDGPVVFHMGEGRSFGSVISFEGSFARYARQHVQAGAGFIVVATNEGSYGTSAASDQLIGMTRMRAAELGVSVVHAAVTGKSVIIDSTGEFVSATSGFGTQEIIRGVVATPATGTLYASLGDWVMYLAMIVGASAWWRARDQLT